MNRGRDTLLAAALIISLGRPEIERALDLARWPHTDAERAQFHARYFTKFKVPDALAGPAVESIEVITEFRRMELIAEQHARLNDLFARGGFIHEAENALKPFRGHVSIIAHVRFGLVTVTAPNYTVAIAGPNAPQAVGDKTTPIFGDKTQIGADFEVMFDAAAIGQTPRIAIVRGDVGAELARATIDFGSIE